LDLKSHREIVASELFQEEEQKRLEQEMQKRRERIERWRAERKKKELEVTKKEIKGSLLGLYSFQKMGSGM
jgi:ATP-dependent RNA helicase DDX46/PRP5